MTYAMILILSVVVIPLVIGYLYGYDDVDPEEQPEYYLK